MRRFLLSLLNHIFALVIERRNENTYCIFHRKNRRRKSINITLNQQQTLYILLAWANCGNLMYLLNWQRLNGTTVYCIETMIMWVIGVVKVLLSWLHGVRWLTCIVLFIPKQRLNERRRYKCNAFCHRLSPCSGIMNIRARDLPQHINRNMLE